MRNSFNAISFAVAALLAGCASAQAQSLTPSPIGATFVVTGSEAAPWAEGALGAPSAESRALQGKKIVFGARAIAAPQPMACSKPNYEQVAVEPEGLFQGGLKAPAKDAAALGFAPGNVQSLLTGCEVDYHFLDADHALFALNNRIYRLERTKR